MSRTTIRVALIAGGLIIASVGLNAQVYRRPDYRNDPYYGNGPQGRQGRYGYGANPASVVQRVISNLHMAARSSYLDQHEDRHFDKAISELQRFQDRWSRQGRVDTGNLDRAIDNMKHLADARQVQPRARRMLDQDINVLRDLRSQVRWYRD